MGKFVDETGATRHALGNKELNELYRKLENFIADCTQKEYEENKEAIIKVETLIHKRILNNGK